MFRPKADGSLQMTSYLPPANEYAPNHQGFYRGSKPHMALAASPKTEIEGQQGMIGHLIGVLKLAVMN